MSRSTRSTRILAAGGALLVSMALLLTLSTVVAASDSCPVELAGDINCSGDITAADAIYLVNYVFKSGPTPCPHVLAGDLDCLGTTGSGDIIRLVGYLFRGGPPPCDICARHFETGSAPDAEIMALWYAGELTAPPDLQDRMASDLTRIRLDFDSLYPPVESIGFVAPWNPSQIILGVDSATAEAIRGGTYTAWDSLNVLYQMQSYSLYGAVDFAWVLITFAGLKNPTMLAVAYRTLPGSRYAQPNHLVGDWPNVYPLVEGTVVTYLVRNAWGDCLAGCIYSEYWYFVSDGDEVSYIGYWDTEGTPPIWWAAASQNIGRYHQF